MTLERRSKEGDVLHILQNNDHEGDLGEYQYEVYHDEQGLALDRAVTIVNEWDEGGGAGLGGEGDQALDHRGPAGLREFIEDRGGMNDGQEQDCQSGSALDSTDGRAGGGRSQREGQGISPVER